MDLVYRLIFVLAMFVVFIGGYKFYYWRLGKTKPHLTPGKKQVFAGLYAAMTFIAVAVLLIRIALKYELFWLN